MKSFVMVLVFTNTNLNHRKFVLQKIAFTFYFIYLSYRLKISRSNSIKTPVNSI
jgi:hypothetical protein